MAVCKHISLDHVQPLKYALIGEKHSTHCCTGVTLHRCNTACRVKSACAVTSGQRAGQVTSTDLLLSIAAYVCHLVSMQVPDAAAGPASKCQQ
jgi:hypothetical protein